MKAVPPRGRLTAVLICLLVAGMVTPVLAAEPGVPAPTPAQLSALVQAAEESSLYSHSVVDFASTHGLSVSPAQALLSQGDSLLAEARAESQGGSNVPAAVASVQAAMSDYTSAAAAASLAIGRAGLSAAVDYSALVQATTEVNATAAVVASAGASVCAQAGGLSSSPGAFVDACAQLDAKLAAVGSSLTQAAALAAQANGGADAAVDFSQAMALVATARATLNSTQSELQVIASYGYMQRADAYVTAVISPLSSQANATIAAEASANSSFTQFQRTYASYAQVQGSAAASVTSSAVALSTAISGVDTGAVSSSASAAYATAAQVNSNLSALLSLPGISVLASVVSDIQSCQAASGTFVQDVNTASAASDSYSLTALSSFSVYLAALNQESTGVRTNGASYVSAYSTVLADLSSLQGVPGVPPIYASLGSLQVSGSVSGVESSLDAETSAMATVQAAIGSFTDAVAVQSPGIVVQAGLLSAAASEATTASPFLNATGTSVMAQASASFGVVSLAAESFVAASNSSAMATIGAFAADAQALSAGRSALEADTTASLSAASTAGAYLASDLGSRIAVNGAALADVATSLHLFSVLDVSGGASAMSQASLEFQAASAESGQ